MESKLLEFSRMYGFVRSRQLEGTFPGDPKEGVWVITALRLGRGWGNVPENEWPYWGVAENWPPSEPAGLDAKAKNYRILSYQRVRTSNECRYAIARYSQVLASFEITDQWFTAENGDIQLPPAGAETIGSHAVSLIGYSDAERMFQFVNSWGPEWGEGGFGRIPYEFFDRCQVEAWVGGGVGLLPPGTQEAPHRVVEMMWGIPDFAGRVLHVRELYDKSSNERLAWTFAVQHDSGLLDVEELYVRPDYRRRGYGTKLLHALRKLSVQTRLRLRFLIPFADCQPKNLDVVRHLLVKAGHFLKPTKLRWAPLMATPSPAGKSESANVYIPARPALCRAKPSSFLDELPVVVATEEEKRALPVAESTGLLMQPDWRSRSDETFVEAAKSVFIRQADVLRRLA
jgi:GNAT superfamily N-acetyltransferase